MAERNYLEVFGRIVAGTTLEQAKAMDEEQNKKARLLGQKETHIFENLHRKMDSNRDCVVTQQEIEDYGIQQFENMQKEQPKSIEEIFKKYGNGNSGLKYM